MPGSSTMLGDNTAQSIARLVTEEYNMIKIAKRTGAAEMNDAARS
jgi:hypothetical protein